MANNTKAGCGNFKLAEPKFFKFFSRIKWLLSQFIEENRDYGFKIAIYGLLWWVGIYIRFKPLTAFMLKKLIKTLDKYFEKNFSDVINPYVIGSVQLHTETVPVEEYPIWCFWWQGEDGMPFVVRECFKRIKQNNPNVVLITSENIRNYVNFPEIIYEKVDKGLFSATFLSDVLRLTLLANYGGMWIDVTCFNPYSIPDEVKRWPFYSPCYAERLRVQEALHYASEVGDWRPWNLGSSEKNSLVFSFGRDMLQNIVVRKNCIPNYFTIDFVIGYAYRHFPEVKKDVDSRHDINTRCGDLFLLYFNPNRIWNEDEYKKLIEKDWMFKLTYKTLWLEKVNGKDTFYGKLFGHNPEND